MLPACPPLRNGKHGRLKLHPRQGTSNLNLPSCLHDYGEGCLYWGGWQYKFRTGARMSLQAYR